MKLDPTPLQVAEVTFDPTTGDGDTRGMNSQRNNWWWLPRKERVAG
jgi:hypothetical protein